jgi:hypothetical protein
MSTPAVVIPVKKIPWRAIGIAAVIVLVVGVVWLLSGKTNKSETNTVITSSSSSTGPTTDSPSAPCSRSMVVVKDPANWRELRPGTYNIDRNSYELKVWPPIQVEAYGGSNTYVKYSYPVESGVNCPNYSNLVLDRDKNWTKLVLTAI